MRSRILAVIAVVALPWHAVAADPAATAKVVAPYLDDQTLAVAHVDLTGLDVDAAVDRFAKVAGIDASMLAGPRKSAREAVAAFRKAGAKELYAVLSVADFPSPGPFVLVPRAGTNDAELKTALSILGLKTIESLDGVMFAGGKSTLDRLRGLKPAARPDLETALQAIAGSPLQVAFIPGDDHRRIVAELMPTLPKEAGGGPGTILTKGARWAAVGIETKPNLAVKIVVRSDDAAAAAAFAQAINQGLNSLSRDKGTRQAVPTLDEMIGLVRPKVEGDRLTITVDDSAPGLASQLAALIGQSQASASRSVSMNNLKQLALAFHNYHDGNRTLPPAAIMSKDGKPLLSWRVAILPYLDQNELYKQFKLDESWDSEHNKALIEKMPKTYRSPFQKVGDGKTTYLAPTGTVDKGHIGVLGVRIADINDGTSNTIMLVEVNDDAAVVWTKPDDLTVDVKDPLKGLIGHYEQGFAAAFADGSVRLIRRTIKPLNLNGIFTRDGGEVVDLSDF